MMDDLVQRIYANRDHQAQGEHYLRHISAMTAEGLHAKSAIAGELAYRDMEIERLRAELAEWEKLRDPSILHANLLRGLPAQLDRDKFLHLAGDAAMAQKQ
jgi:hypothetical protein